MLGWRFERLELRRSFAVATSASPSNTANAPSIAADIEAFGVGALPPTEMVTIGTGVAVGSGMSSGRSPRTATLNVPGRLLVLPHVRQPYSAS